VSERREEPNLSISDDAGIIDAPMPEALRTRIGVFRYQLEELRTDCKAIKRRARAVPYVVTLGWAALTAAAYSAVGWFVSRESDPRPSHSIFVMYQLGVLIGFLVAALLLLWGWSSRRHFKDDVDDLMEKIHSIDYASTAIHDGD
jgi:hypothetical protein